jgi:Flp pilus assembly protein TadD
MTITLWLALASAAASTAPASKPTQPAPTIAPTTAPSAASLIRDAEHAISAGRLEEARLLIGRAVAAGATGPALERVLADLAYQTGKFDEALSHYKHLVQIGQKDARVCEMGALAALHVGKWVTAKPLADCAVSSPASSWRAWNARGVIADFEKDWSTADRAYARAHELAPDEAEVINNEGWSHILRGDWAGSLPLLQDAAKLEPSSARIANNLDLAQSALDSDLPARRPGESDASWAQRLNDAGVAAELGGDRKRAIAAFTRALHASGVWYARASNNLDAVSKN